MRSNYVQPAVIVLILLSVICIAGIVVMMMRSPGNPPVQQTPAAVQEEWDPERDCDEEDKAKGDWEDCWAEFLTKKGKSPTPRPTAVRGQVLPQGTPRITGPSTAAVPAPPRTPGPVRTTKRKP